MSEESFTYASFVLHDFDEIVKVLDRIERDDAEAIVCIPYWQKRACWRRTWQRIDSGAFRQRLDERRIVLPPGSIMPNELNAKHCFFQGKFNSPIVVLHTRKLGGGVGGGGGGGGVGVGAEALPPPPRAPAAGGHGGGGRSGGRSGGVGGVAAEAGPPPPRAPAACDGRGDGRATMAPLPPPPGEGGHDGACPGAGGSAEAPPAPRGNGLELLCEDSGSESGPEGEEGAARPRNARRKRRRLARRWSGATAASPGASD